MEAVVIDPYLADLELGLLAVVLVREGGPGQPLKVMVAHRLAHREVDEPIQVFLETCGQINTLDVLGDVLEVQSQVVSVEGKERRLLEVHVLPVLVLHEVVVDRGILLEIDLQIRGVISAEIGQHHILELLSLVLAYFFQPDLLLVDLAGVVPLDEPGVIPVALVEVLLLKVLVLDAVIVVSIVKALLVEPLLLVVLEVLASVHGLQERWELDFGSA